MARWMKYTADEIIIHDEVYDVTRYIMDHPGGIEILIQKAGTDANDLFDNAGHSDDAFELMVSCGIGRLKGRVQTESKTSNDVQPAVGKLDSSKKVRRSTGVPLAFLSLGIAATSYRILKGNGGISALLPPNNIPQIATLMHVLSTFNASYLKGLVASSLERDPLLRRGWLGSVSSPLPLVKKMLIAPNVYRLVFSLPPSQEILGLPTGQHVTITATVDGEKVTKSFTPVSNNLDYGTLELVVKIYPEGNLTGGHLADLQLGDEVHFRGPKGAMRYSYGLSKKKGMLAAAVCEYDRDTTEISLIYASQTENDILLLPSLGNDVKIMVCGPAGIVTSAKKFLEELGYETPGASPGISDQVFIL
ncbi:hypothetical protein V8C42DRAFT_360587 [Trichoderma barbatum]